jgi:hypothetical protein
MAQILRKNYTEEQLILEREANSESELDDDTVAAGDYRNASGS